MPVMIPSSNSPWLRVATLVPLAGASWVFVPCSASAADGSALVDCSFPGQVRRLGAYSSTVTPRRQAKVTADECRQGGGEYIETVPAAAPDASPAGARTPPDLAATLKLWQPLAEAGQADAQARVGEVAERMGDLAQARAWYEQSAQQGNLRAKVNLAGLYERGAGIPRDVLQAQTLIVQAAGLPTSAGGPRIQLVDPSHAIRLPGPPAVNGDIAIDAGPGPVNLTARAESPVGIASVTVNGARVAYNAEGVFTLPVPLDDGPASVKIAAVDQAGRSGQAEFTLRRLTESAPATPAHAAMPDALSGKRLALVIANQDYQRWDKLDTPLADANAMAGLLRSRFGFNVTLVSNATRQDMLQALGKLRATAGPDDQVIVFYAGHGQMDPVTARGYWIPVDGDVRDLSRWVSVIDVTDQLSAMQARHVLVIADSCYSGTLAGSLATRVDAALSAEQRQRHLNQLTTRRARVAFTSGGLEPVIDGGGGGHSLFTRSLLDVLEQVQGPVTLHELSTTVSARFSLLGKPLKVSQHPQYAPIAFAGHEAGDFVLTPTP